MQRRKRAQVATSSLVGSWCRRCLRPSGAVTSRAWSWLAAWLLAFTADWRTDRKTRIISTRPSPLLGSPRASPAYSLPWLLPPRRWGPTLAVAPEMATLLGLSTSITEIPAAFRWRASLRPRSCWCLLSQRTSRGQSPPPSTGASRNPFLRSLVGSTRSGACPDGPRPPPCGSPGVCVHTQDHLDLGIRSLGTDHSHVRAAPFDVAVTFHPTSRRERTNVL